MEFNTFCQCLYQHVSLYLGGQAVEQLELLPHCLKTENFFAVVRRQVHEMRFDSVLRIEAHPHQ